MALIELQMVRKVYERYVAVESLDLTVRDGEFLVLLGPSGCGKTTTLNMIAGLDYPTAGKIVFDGREVTTETPHSRNVAMVFQSSLLYPHLTVRKNIDASLRHSGLPANERVRRIEEAAQLLELSPLLDKLPSQMSGGQRQRAATAKAIVREPAVFLLDEPLSALDATLRLSLRSELVNIQKRLGTTTIFVTHDQVEAMTMGDRIAVMSKGRIEQIGTPDEIYNHPENLFVASFIGSPPMNVIEGRIADMMFTSGPLRLALPPGIGVMESQSVTLGVRPQHMVVAAADAAEGLPVTVFSMEHLGRESVVIGEDDEKRKLRALVDPRFVAKVGDRLRLLPQTAFCMLFRPDGQRLDASDRHWAATI